MAAAAAAAGERVGAGLAVHERVEGRIGQTEADVEIPAGLAAGLPAPVVELSLGMFVASRQGEFAPADPTLERLIHREPVPLRDVLKDALPPGR